MIELRTLALKDKEAFLELRGACWEEDFIFAHYFISLADQSFEKYLEVLPMISLGKLIPPDHAPSTLLFAFDHSGEMVGRVSIRHYLTADSMMVNGHIGYGVAPAHRQKGHASEILRQALIYTKAHLPEISRVLLTCDVTNTASSRTILKNGGVLENVYSGPLTKVPKSRYWIDLL